MPKRRHLRAFDLKQIRGFDGLIGVDEVGRGALAGPVVASAVRVSRDFLDSRWAVTRSGKVNDSKKLTPEVREIVVAQLEKLALTGAIRFSIGSASVSEIEQLNVFGATKLAMRRALAGIYPPEAFHEQREPDLFSPPEAGEPLHPRVSCRILIDGIPLKVFPYPHTGLVNGDERSLCIAMASILAKVTRDRMMVALDEAFPQYGFARHKGYSTDDHRAALMKRGSCLHHRDLFLRKLYSGDWDIEGQLKFFEE